MPRHVKWVLPVLLSCVGAALPGAASLGAQARLSGVVFDSVAGKPLGSAFVQIALVSDPSVSRSVRADDKGRFRVDSLRSGSWMLAAMHPRIDSLGIEQLARVVSIGHRGEQRATLAVPSMRTLVRDVCGDSAAAEGSGFVHGRLRRLPGAAERSEPAIVEVRWVDMLVSVTKGVGVTRVPRREAMPAQPDGAFSVCGVPPGGTVRVRGLSGSDSTGVVELVVPEHGIARQDLAVGPVTHATVDSAPVRRGAATLRGRVTGPGGTPLPNVAVVVWGAESSARSDSAGYWQLRQLPAGTHMVETRAIGYQVERQIVDIGDPAAGNELMVTLSRMVTLDTVRTRALRESLFEPNIRAFEQRRKIGIGTYRGPEEIDRIMPFEAANLFSSVPGIRIIPSMEKSLFMGNKILLRGGTTGEPCTPDLVIDRQRINSNVHGGFIDQWVLFSQVRAVEVYQALTGTPPEFLRVGNDCGTIVIWTGRR